MSSLYVLKFGGSSLSSPERIHRVARIIKAHKERGDQLVVVVSAMGDSTDELLALAQKVSPHAQRKSHRRELDMLLSSGERVSMALLSMALSDLGLEALSFTGSQSGIITTQIHGEARIEDIRPIRIVETLKQNKISIVAGFQGVSAQKEITTLGRGGSDTSAVALGAKLGANEVYIYTDVDGFYSADPRQIKNAFAWKKLSTQVAYASALKGAGVLHARCLEVALKNQTTIRVLSSFLDNESIENNLFFKNGTLITPSKDFYKMEQAQFFTLNQSPKVSLLQLKYDSTEGIEKAVLKLQHSKLSWLALKSDEEGIEIICQDSLVEDFCEALEKPTLHQKGLLLVSLIGAGLNTAPELTQKVFEILESESLKIYRSSLSNEALELLIEETPTLNAALSKIHNLIQKH